MAIKIVLVSDSHGDLAALNNVLARQQDVDYYLHAGDVVLNPAQIKPFAAVKGNCDYENYVQEKIIAISDNLKILLVHGHRQKINTSRLLLANYAHNKGCKIALYGHSHLFKIEKINDVYCINPGCLRGNRDGSGAT